LRANGYWSALVGSYGLGTPSVNATESGFDLWKVQVEANLDSNLYFNPVFTENIDNKASSVTYNDVHVTTQTTDLTIDALINAPDDQPFFVMMSLRAPQRNSASPLADLDFFGKKTNFTVPASFFTTYTNVSWTSTHADNRVADLYRSWDLKVNLDSTDKVVGTGGGLFKNSTTAYTTWLKTLNANQTKTWNDYYGNLS